MRMVPAVPKPGGGPPPFSAPAFDYLSLNNTLNSWKSETCAHVLEVFVGTVLHLETDA